MANNPLNTPGTTLDGDQEVALQVRKLVTYVEEIRSEGGRAQDPPVRVAAAIAIIANPYAGRWVEDLGPLQRAFGPALGQLLGSRAVAALDGDEAEAVGKGVLVGTGGELEHGSALIHTLRFGNPFRDLVGGTELLPSAEKVGAVGASLDIALKHKNDHSIRSHHQTFEIRVPDAPRADEILIACAVANGGRPNARSGSGPASDFGAENGR